MNIKLSLNLLSLLMTFQIIACGDGELSHNHIEDTQNAQEVSVDLACSNPTQACDARTSNFGVDLDKLNLELAKADAKFSYLTEACKNDSLECPDNHYYQLLYSVEDLEGTRWTGSLVNNLKCINKAGKDVSCFQDENRQITNLPQNGSLIAGKPQQVKRETINGISVAFVTINNQKYLVNRCSAKPSEAVFFGSDIFANNPYASADFDASKQVGVSHIPVTCELPNNLALTLTDKYKLVSNAAKKKIRESEIEGLVLTAAIGAAAFAILGPAATLFLTQLGIDEAGIGTMAAIAQGVSAAGGGAYMAYSAVKSGYELKQCRNDECRMHARFNLVSDAIFAGLSFADFGRQVSSAYKLPAQKASGMGKIVSQWNAAKPKYISMKESYIPLLENQSKVLAAGIMDDNVANIIRGQGNWKNVKPIYRKFILNRIAEKPWDILDSNRFWKKLSAEITKPISNEEAMEFANKIDQIGEARIGERQASPQLNSSACGGFNLAAPTGPMCKLGSLDHEINYSIGFFANRGGGIYNHIGEGFNLSYVKNVNKIGQGAYGSISKIRIEDESFALKSSDVHFETLGQTVKEMAFAVSFGLSGIGPKIYYAELLGGKAKYIMDLAEKDASKGMTTNQIYSYGQKIIELLEYGFIALDDKPGNILLRGDEAFMHDFDFVYSVTQFDRIPHLSEFGTFAPYEALNDSMRPFGPYQAQNLQSFYFGFNVLLSEMGWSKLYTILRSSISMVNIEGRNVINGSRLSAALEGMESQTQFSKAAFDALRSMIESDYSKRPSVKSFLKNYY